MVDIFNPEVSKVIKGMKGKSVLIYGANRTGKTSNLVKAPKPLVCCFENGLNAIDSIKNIKVKKWNDWIQEESNHFEIKLIVSSYKDVQNETFLFFLFQ